MAKIKGQIKSIWPDRTMYKPYAYNLEMKDVWVEIEIPDEEVKYRDVNLPEGGLSHTETILTLDGFTVLLGSIADAIDVMHETYSKAQTAKRQDENKRKFEN